MKRSLSYCANKEQTSVFDEVQREGEMEDRKAIREEFFKNRDPERRYNESNAVSEEVRAERVKEVEAYAAEAIAKDVEALKDEGLLVVGTNSGVYYGTRNKQGDHVVVFEPATSKELNEDLQFYPTYIHRDGYDPFAAHCGYWYDEYVTPEFVVSVLKGLGFTNVEWYTLRVERFNPSKFLTKEGYPLYYYKFDYAG